jgi:hypothetical protein
VRLGCLRRRRFRDHAYAECNRHGDAHRNTDSDGHKHVYSDRDIDVPAAPDRYGCAAHVDGDTADGGAAPYLHSSAYGHHGPDGRADADTLGISHAG